MINYFQIQKLSSKKNVPEEIIEKDYLIELVLFYLAKDRCFKEKLIFRGGTALKKIYFSDYRISEDLDFLIKDEGNLRECEQKLDQLLAKISSKYPFRLNKYANIHKDRLQFFITYNIVPEIIAVKELRVDILKDRFTPSFQKREIKFTYQEFKQEKVELNVYLLESVASDKICRILEVDNEPRDIYDLWYLLKLNLDAAKIKEEFKNRYTYDIPISNLLSEIAKEDYKRNWYIRLEKQIGELPPYEIIVKELKKLIKKNY